jgi:hypothetical protein
MLPHIKRYEPPKRRLRIRNIKRLIVSLILIVLAFLAIIIPRQGTSQVEFVEYQVGYGDTYWGIAQQLQKRGYKPNTDVRNVIDELIRKSGIMAHELKESDIIYIPDLEVISDGRSKMD